MKRKAPYPTFRYWLNDETDERQPIEADSLSEEAITADGHLLIGSSGQAPVTAPLTGGLGINISNGPGFIVINADQETLPEQNDGELLIGWSGNTPVAAELTGGSGISITNGPGSITIDNTPSPLPVDRPLVSDPSGIISAADAMSDGQFLIGSTGSSPVVSSLAAGANISIINGPGSVTVSADQEALPTQTDGELLVGLTGNPPVATSLTGGSGITVTNGPGSITIDADQETLPAQTDGQLLIGSTGNPPVAALLTAGAGISIQTTPGGITIAQNLLAVSKVSAATSTNTSTTTNTLIDQMTVTPGAGDYLVFFDGLLQHDTSNRWTAIIIYVNGSPITNTERILNVAATNNWEHIGTMTYITNVGATDDIEVRWRTETGNTATFNNRAIIAVKLAA